MKTIYLDSDYVCHIEPAPGLTPYETDFFDNMCNAYIEGYRIVPEGYIWTRSDGIQFAGLMISPAVPYSKLLAKQEQYIEDSDNMIPLEDVAELIEAIYNADMEIIEE